MDEIARDIKALKGQSLQSYQDDESSTGTKEDDDNISVHNMPYGAVNYIFEML